MRCFIHYAYIRESRSGTVRGMVAHFTYRRFSASPLLGIFGINNVRSGVTRSRSVSNCDSKYAYQQGANPRPAWLTADLPPKKILYRLCEASAKSLQTRAAIGFPAVLAVDFGTSPHGLFADNPPAHQETRCTDGGRFPAKPVLTVGEFPPVGQAHERRNVVPRLRRASAFEELHRLELTEREFLHAHAAVAQERNRTRQAIRQGKATAQDLQATDGLWDKLQAVMFARMKGGQA